MTSCFVFRIVGLRDKLRCVYGTGATWQAVLCLEQWDYVTGCFVFRTVGLRDKLHVFRALGLHDKLFCF